MKGGKITFKPCIPHYHKNQVLVPLLKLRHKIKKKKNEYYMVTTLEELLVWYIINNRNTRDYNYLQQRYIQSIR